MRWLRWVPAVVLFFGAALVFDYARRLSEQQPVPPRTAVAPVPLPPQLDELDALAGVADGAVQPGEPLDRNPADLPAHRDGRLLTRYAVKQDATTDEYAIWSFDGGEGKAIESFYADAALGKGFVPVASEQASTRRVRRLTLMRGGERLLIRTRQTAGGVRLVLHLRYTLHSP